MRANRWGHDPPAEALRLARPLDFRAVNFERQQVSIGPIFVGFVTDMRNLLLVLFIFATSHFSAAAKPAAEGHEGAATYRNPALELGRTAGDMWGGPKPNPAYFASMIRHIRNDPERAASIRMRRI